MEQVSEKTQRALTTKNTKSTKEKEDRKIEDRNILQEKAGARETYVQFSCP